MEQNNKRQETASILDKGQRKGKSRPCVANKMREGRRKKETLFDLQKMPMRSEDQFTMTEVNGK